MTGQPSWRAVRRVAGLVAAAVAGAAVAAFATLPPSGELEVRAMLERRVAVEPLAGAQPPEPLVASGPVLREESLRAGEPLAQFFARAGVASAEAAALAQLAELRRLRPGAVALFEFDADGSLLALEVARAPERLLRVAREAGEWRARETELQTEVSTEYRSGTIRSSLFAAADEARLPEAIAMQLAEIYAGEIDFHRDLRVGDRFAVIYEVERLRGRPVRIGRVLAAEFVNRGRTLRALWFPAAGGYYDGEGRSLRRAFLRSPIAYSRVTSGFGLRRHPFLETWRAHQGVDYAAPTGTPVRATAEGSVEHAGWRSGYGLTVVLRHAGAVTTLYAHLSAIAPGLRPGVRVAQGQTLGRVGQTGWATGPHLHYELRIAGAARDPLTVKLPVAEPLAPALRRNFERHAAILLERLAFVSVAAADTARFE